MSSDEQSLETTPPEADDQLSVAGDDADITAHGDGAPSDGDAGGLVDGAGREDSTSATEPVVEVPAWQQAFQEAGFQDVESIDDVAARSIEAIQLRDEQNRSLAEQVGQLNQQIKFYQDQMGRQMPPTGQPGQPAQPQTQEPEPDLFTKLQQNWVDPQWARQYVEFDENGERRWVNNPDAETQAKVNQADQNLRDFQELFTDPNKFIAAIDSRIERAARQQFESGWTERQSQQQMEQTRQQFTQENESWLYQHDPATGALMRDPVSRDPLFSPEGQQFVEYMLHADAQGISRLDHQLAYAMQQRELNQLRTGVTPQAASQSVADANQQRKREMIGRANERPRAANSVNGVNGDSTVPTGNAQMSFGERAVEAFKQQTGAA